MKLSVTIPAFNEEKTIEQVSKNAIGETAKLFNNFELLLVDDGSIDRTGRIMEEIKKQYKDRVRVIHHRKNMGFSGAMKTCYEKAKGDLIFLGPADGQFDYQELKLFLEKIKDRDIVVAYRVLNEERFYRKANSFFFHLLSRLLFGIKLREFSSCILYNKHVRNSISIEAHPYSCLFLPEFLYKAIKKRYRFGEVPIHFYRRKEGVQKGTNIKMIIKTLEEMLKFWWDIKRGKVVA